MVQNRQGIKFLLVPSAIATAKEVCSFSPTAKITTTPVSGSSPDFVFRDGTEVAFSGATSTAPVTQADGAVLPFADAFYTGLLLGKLGTTIYDAATFTDEEIIETMLARTEDTPKNKTW